MGTHLLTVVLWRPDLRPDFACPGRFWCVVWKSGMEARGGLLTTEGRKVSCRKYGDAMRCSLSSGSAAAAAAAAAARGGVLGILGWSSECLLKLPR